MLPKPEPLVKTTSATTINEDFILYLWPQSVWIFKPVGPADNLTTNTEASEQTNKQGNKD